MKTRILINEAEYKLVKANCMDPKIDAEELFCYVTGMDRLGIFMRAEEEVDEETEKKYMDIIMKRAERIPLQHITGVQEFMGYRFKVSPDVLIPRMDTEVLVTEAARIIKETPKDPAPFLKRLMGGKPWEVLDLCCGSGAIGISLGKICDNISVTMTDISPEALAVAKENAAALHYKAVFKQGDMFEAVGDKTFDMIVTNPPYVRTRMISILQEEVKCHEPLIALDGGQDGLNFYRIILEKAPAHLKPEGILVMEIGDDQGEDLRKMVKDSGAFTPAKVIRDLPGRERVVVCRLLKGHEEDNA